MRYLNDIPAAGRDFTDANHAKLSPWDLNEALYVYIENCRIMDSRVEDPLTTAKTNVVPRTSHLNDTTVCVDRPSFDQRDQPVEFSTS